MLRRLTLLLLAALAAALLATARPAVAFADDGDDEGNGGNNAAIAINTKDGSSLFRLAFSIREVAGDVVENENAAVAFSSCNSCQTVAIAIQIVLITGDPSVVTPSNVAIAVNYQCTLCETLASAYQFVVTTGGPVRFTDEGRREINRIRHELRELRKSGLSIVEIQARVDDLMRQLAQVLKTELVPAGPKRDKDKEKERGPPPETTTTEATTTTTTTTPTESTTESTTTPSETTTTTTPTTTTTTTTSP